jgi:hypothetical protein
MYDSNEDLPLGESVELEPGLLVQRRCFLKTAAIALGSIAMPGALPSVADASARSDWSIEEFVTEVVPVAEALLKDRSLLGQDYYLLTLASYAVQLTNVPEPEFRDSGQGVGPGTFIGLSGAPGPFVMLQWKMDPNTEIRRHAHSYGNVVTFGLDGATRVENFEVVGERDYDSTDSFRVRRTLTQWMTPGSTNLVSLERNYIHGYLTSSQGARGLDITTRLYERRPTPYLELGEPVPGESNVFVGAWEM